MNFRKCHFESQWIHKIHRDSKLHREFTVIQRLHWRSSSFKITLTSIVSRFHKIHCDSRHTEFCQIVYLYNDRFSIFSLYSAYKYTFSILHLSRYFRHEKFCWREILASVELRMCMLGILGPVAHSWRMCIFGILGPLVFPVWQIYILKNTYF